MSDLAAYADLASRIAALGAEDEITLKPADFTGPLAAQSRFDGLVIDTNYQRFLGWAGEGEAPFEIIDRSFGFNAYGLPDGYRRLGLWLLHLLFSGRRWAGLELTHPKSRARWLYARIQRPAAPAFGLQIAEQARFSGYVHMPMQVCRHPFAGPDMAPMQRIESEADRPFFAYGWSKERLREQWVVERADQIIYEATPGGLAAMAGLFFDFPHAELGCDEVNMEPPFVGFAGTQPRSIEARFWLPGSFGFPEQSLNDIHLPPFARQ